VWLPIGNSDHITISQIDLYAMQAMHETKSQEITSSIKPVVLALPNAHPLMPSFFRWAHDLNIVLG
jgi:hypothetical protein